MFDLITIGDATVDTFIIIDDKDTQVRVDSKKKELIIRYAEKVCITNVDQSIGGNAANVSVAARKLGLSTAIVGSIGDDVNGIAIAHELSVAGVDTTYLQLQKNKETRFSVVLNVKQERTILSYHGDRTYRFPALPETHWIYFTSLGEGTDAMQKALLRYLKKHPNTKLAVNPGSFQMKNRIDSLRALLPYADLLFVNVEEAQMLINSKKRPKACLTALRKLGAKTVVITDSDRGAYAASQTEMLHMPIYPIKSIAKTGAGDAFAGACLAAQQRGKSLSESLQWGAANAAGVIQLIGAHKGLLTERGVKKIISNYKKIKPAGV